MGDTYIYSAHVTLYENFIDSNRNTVTAFLSATGLADAIDQITEYYGDAEIRKVEIELLNSLPFIEIEDDGAAAQFKNYLRED